MKRCLAACIMVFSFAVPSFADSCDDLISSFEGALADPNLSPAMKEQIERLLGAGRDAKSRGDVAACAAARKVPLQSTPGGGPGGANHKCEKPPQTV